MNPVPFPSLEGERKVSGSIERKDSVQIKGRELPSDTNIDTLDDATLARVITWHAKPLQLDSETLVEPIGSRKNKNRTILEFRFIEPRDKAVRNELGTSQVVATTLQCKVFETCSKSCMIGRKR